MSRLENKFQELKNAGRKGLVIYITAGMPDAESTAGLVLEAEKAGADIIELGVPFSDPMADGPVIQAAAYTAIKNGMTVKGVLEIVREIRKTSQIPLVGMGYVNNMLHYGFEKFTADAAEAGLDGLIVPDVPHEESAEMKAACKANGMHLVEFVTPGTTDSRISETCTFLHRAPHWYLRQSAYKASGKASGNGHDYRSDRREHRNECTDRFQKCTYRHA